MSCDGGHLGFPIGIKNSNLVKDIPMIVLLQFGFSQFISFREEVLWNFSQSEHIIGPGSHIEYPSGTKNSNFVEDHPMNIPVKFGSNRPSGFGEEAWNVKSLQTTDANSKLIKNTAWSHSEWVSDVWSHSEWVRICVKLNEQFLFRTPQMIKCSVAWDDSNTFVCYQVNTYQEEVCWWLLYEQQIMTFSALVKQHKGVWVILICHQTNTDYVTFCPCQTLGVWWFNTFQQVKTYHENVFHVLPSVPMYSSF